MPEAHRRAEPLIHLLLTLFGRELRRCAGCVGLARLAEFFGASNKPLRGAGRCVLWSSPGSRVSRADQARMRARSAPAGFIAPLFVIAALGGGLAACGSGNNERLGERVIPLGQPVPKGGGVYQVGKPYQISRADLYPREEPGYDRVGNASWYGELFHGRRTANGEIYDMDGCRRRIRRCRCRSMRG